MSLPSEYSRVNRTPRVPPVSADSTTAPAPSPNRMQLLRSEKSTARVSVSDPTTRACRTLPPRRNWSATVTA